MILVLVDQPDATDTGGFIVTLGVMEGKWMAKSSNLGDESMDVDGRSDVEGMAKVMVMVMATAKVKSMKMEMEMEMLESVKGGIIESKSEWERGTGFSGLA